MAYTFNGIGKAFYGKRDFDLTTKTFTTTEFWVFLNIPIIPIRSLRVKHLVHESFNMFFVSSVSDRYLGYEIGLSLKQVFFVYSYFIIFLFGIICFVYFLISYKQEIIFWLISIIILVFWLSIPSLLWEVALRKSKNITM